MEEYLSFFKQNPNVTLATKNGDGISTRIFQYLWHEGTHVYFCTANNKPVFEQLKKDPNVSFCVWNQQSFESVSVNGKAVFVDDMAKKERVLTENPMIKQIYKEAANPVFKIFYVDVESVDMFSFAKGKKHIDK